MPHRFTLRQLEYLVTVGDLGSIALAAERLNVSSPTISTAIAQIEADFGLTLFVRRHAQGLSLTQAGRQVAAQARAVLAEAGRLVDLAAQIAGMVRGPLHAGCLLTFAQIVLPGLRRSFCDRYPDVVFQQSERHQSDLFEALRDGTLDLALTYDLNIPADLRFEALAVLPPCAVMSPDHPLADRASVTAADLAPHPMVLLDLPMSVDYFRAFFAAEGVAPRIAERTRDLTVMHGLVASGFGYSIANIRPAADRAADGRALVHVPLTSTVRPLTMGLVLPGGAGLSLTVQAFVDHAKETVSPATTPGLRAPG
ncbi:MAG: LysR substrate-binding domain-containing protein [Gemmobacter sp.]